MTTPKNGGRLPINFGQRYIINAKKNAMSLIMPLEFNKISGNFKNIQIDTFTQRKTPEALLVTFPMMHEWNMGNKTKDLWKKAIQQELSNEKIKKSGFRKSHNPAYYRAVMNLQYRQKILNSAFS